MHLSNELKLHLKSIRKICTSKLHFTAIFIPIKFALYKRIYDYLPENTLSEKIIKIRKCNNLDRIEFGEAIGHYWSSVQQLELN